MSPRAPRAAQPSTSNVAGAAVLGVAHHNGWAVLVTAAADGTLLDRRRIELVDDDLPAQPHHHEAQALPLDEALDLVERVRRSAEHHASLGLQALAETVSPPIAGIALRQCPPLPATVAERIASYRAQCVADSVMYRVALAEAARARGWAVHWYDARTVLAAAAAALGVDDLEPRFAGIRAAIGPPWRQDHRIAMAAAIVAARA